MTRNDVRRFPGATFHEYPNHKAGDFIVTTTTNTQIQLAKLFKVYKPDIMVIHGDVAEAHAAATVAAQFGIRIMHVEGGEKSGSIDESYRYAITAFSHIHLVCSQSAKERILATGQNPDSVFLIGSPELDVHNKLRDVPLAPVLSRHVKQSHNGR